MPPSSKTFSIVRRIAAKETTLFFASPIAYLFLGSFTAVTLFIVFWGEAFFARNIADVRPMFEWMPILLIVLCSTLTMRMWSEERRTGTLEHVITQPISLWAFVLGKFLSCLNLLALALLITLPLPLTVSLMGDLDWGPVLAGYLASFLLGAAYLAIGLFVSAKSSNQIVSLLSATAICGLLYLVGSPVVTNLVGASGAELLRQLGSGARFQSIGRGMVNLADLAYYFSLVIGFLALNTFSLEKERWSQQAVDTPRHSLWRLVTALIIANAIVLNLWMGQTSAFRVDFTAGQQYTVSKETQKYLQGLQQPLLIRGYFSSKTHPLLAPLVPQLKDLIAEYAIAGGSKVRVEFIDPTEDQKLADDAAQDYGIKPVPFQIADRYQAAIVSSYFSILVKYGNEFKVIDFQDLIEVKASSPQDLKVYLRNPEYDLTKAVKKVVDSYQASGNIFSKIKEELSLTAYVSNDSLLPAKLVEFKKPMQAAIDKLVSESGGKLKFQEVDPLSDGGKVAEELATKYGLKPMTTDILSGERFYFYLILTRGDQVVPVSLEGLDKANLDRSLNSALKRFASGFSKTIALVTPEPDAPFNPYGGPPPGDFQLLEQFLASEYKVNKEDLSDGSVSSEADVLLLAAPKALDEKAIFAIDQFLMQGGTVIASTSPYRSNFSDNELTIKEEASGLDDWLSHYGIKIDKKLVMDSQNAALPIPIMRNIGGMQVQDVQMLDYPYFLDIRKEGFPTPNPITAELPQLTLAWPSPLSIDTSKLQDLKAVELIRSSDKSWLSTDTNITPFLGSSSSSGFIPGPDQKSYLVGEILSGHFQSSFKGKTSPLQAQSGKDKGTSNINPQTSKVIERSLDSAKLIIFASNDMIRDTAIKLESSGTGSQYLNGLQMIANTIDWATEDSSLLGIRARGNYNRTLPPMDKRVEMIWEGVNYFLAALGLALVALYRHRHEQKRRAIFEAMLGE